LSVGAEVVDSGGVVGAVEAKAFFALFFLAELIPAKAAPAAKPAPAARAEVWAVGGIRAAD